MTTIECQHGEEGRLYHFDVLPIHPPPQPFESLTSYLTRLGEANGLQRLRQLAEVCFPKQAHSMLSNGMGDFSSLRLAELCRATATSQPQLRATTFYFMAHRFGRSVLPVPTAKFLSGSLSSSLRYCPACIAETGYYRLQWRFLMLSACPVHRSRLLDTCGHCKGAIPLLASPLRIRVCKICNGDLTACTAPAASKDEIDASQQAWQDLEVVLSPCEDSEIESESQESDVGQITAAALSRRFTALRRARGLTLSEAADIMGLSYNCLHSLEAQDVRRGGSSFAVNILYTKTLGVSLRTVLDPVHYAEYLTQIKSGAPQEHKSRSLTKAEDKLLEAVHKAIEELREAGERVSQQNVARRVLRSRERLRCYPGIKSILDKLPYDRVPRPRQGKVLSILEAEYLARTRMAIEELTGKGEILLTRAAVARMVGVTKPTLYKYPTVRALLNAVIPVDEVGEKARYLAHEDYLLARTKAALLELEASNSHITHMALWKTAGLMRSRKTALQRYPRLRTLIEETAERLLRQQRSARRQTREDELLAAIFNVIVTAKERGILVTQQTISHTVGMNVHALSKYPRIHAVLREVNAEKKRLLKEKAAERVNTSPNSAVGTT